MKKRRIDANINVVPYIDVMLVLLVIFMVATPIINQSILVSLPQEKGKPIKSSKELPLIITLNKMGNYYLQNGTNEADTPYKESEVIARVAAETRLGQQKNQKKSTLLKIDKDVNYGKVVHIMAKLKQAGVDKVGLLTSPADQSLAEINHA